MGVILGFILICTALTFFVTFVMGEGMTIKEKVKLSLEIVFFISMIVFGAYLLEPYIK